jgi:CDP-glycerol glycerophosphotransferase (TagB/SpsB family)
VIIVYQSFEGQYGDNPRVLYDRLRVEEPDAGHVWLADPAHAAMFPADVETVGIYGPECRSLLESADVLIANTHTDIEWHKRPDAFYLQTWHGTPLKRIHNDVRWAPEGRLARLDRDVARWDAMLSPNPASTPLLRRAFGFTGPVHETGYPRNDVLTGPDAERVRTEVRRGLGVPDRATVVLYAPTWRDDVVFATGEHALPLDLGDFARALGDEHVLLLRLHSLVSAGLELETGAPVRDVSLHPDIAELYLAADVLVTDYSSAMFDFAVTGRPILLFTYDLADYRDRLRGFYLDLEEIAPGPLLATSDEVLTALRDLDAVRSAHAGRYAEFRRTFNPNDDGHAGERVLERFFPIPAAATAPGTVPHGGGRHAHP